MIYHGDCLKILQTIESKSIDLVCLDPPYNSGRVYTGVVDGEDVSFDDTWEWDLWEHEYKDLERSSLMQVAAGFHRILGDSSLMAYLSFMANRLEECYRVLKDSGSIYLHTDPRVSHYLKIIMDYIFGNENFRNDLVWVRDGAGRGAKRLSKQWPREYDSILFYTVGNKHTFKQQYMQLSQKQRELYRYKDEKGWYKTAEKGAYTSESLDKLRAEGRLHRSASGNEWPKYYLEDAMATIGSVWIGIYGFVTRTADKEKNGYPTQKPVNLLERIIEASSNEGDVVLDPFCGSGSSLVAAQQLGRRVIGIDENESAVRLSRQRLEGADRKWPLLAGTSNDTQV